MKTSTLEMKRRFDCVQYATDTCETHIRIGNGHVALFDRDQVDELVALLTVVRTEQDAWSNQWVHGYLGDVADSETPLARAQRFMGEAD